MTPLHGGASGTAMREEASTPLSGDYAHGDEGTDTGDGNARQPRQSRVSFKAAAYSSTLSSVGKTAGVGMEEAERAVGMVEEAATAAASAALRALGPYASEASGLTLVPPLA